jgi:hypothetical protein
MNRTQQQNEDVYDSVFNFIFDAQKKKEKKEIPRNTQGISEYTDYLMEIGTQPLVFPLESAFGAINKSLSTGLGVKLEGGVDGGIGSGMFSNPGKYVKAEIAKERTKANWATVGGGVHKAADAALLSLYAKSLGAKGRTATQIGKLYEEAAKVKKNQSNVDLLNESIHLKSDVIAEDDPNLDKGFLNQIMKDLQQEGDKNERIRKSFDLLRQKGLDKKKSLELAYSMWGDVKDPDMGMYHVGRNEWTQGVNKVRENKELTPNQINELEDLKKIEDPQKRRREMHLFLKRKVGLDSKEAFGLSKELANIKINDKQQIANDSMHWALAHQLRKKLEKEGKKVSTRELKSAVAKRLDLEGGNTLGANLERGVLLTRWLSNSNAWGKVLLDGQWEKFGVQGLGLTKLLKEGESGFTEIVKEKKLVDEDGNYLGSYYGAADSVIGKIMGGAYYLHPNNLMRGLVLDGSLWLKWAADKNGVVDKTKFAYLMSRMSLQNSMSVLSKPMQGLSNKVIGIVNPMFNALQKRIKGLAIKILGATGVGGILVNVLMNFVSDRFAEVVNQIVVAVLLAVVAILFAIFGWAGMLFPDQYATAMLESETEVRGESNSKVFEDEDFGEISID